MQLMIECEYCCSLYDFNEHNVCPNCAAVPDKEIVEAAKAAAKAEAKQQAAESAAAVSDKKAEKPPSGMFITILVKLIPLWIFLIIGLTFVPDMKENSIAKEAVQNLQVVDEIEYVSHSMNEEFVYDGKITLSVDDAFYSKSEVVRALLPEGKKMLAIHIKGSMTEEDCEDYSYNDYYNVHPYVTDGSFCRESLSYSALNSIPEVYATSSFSFSNFSVYSLEKDGYWCFIVDEDDTDISLCIGDFSTENYALQLDAVHKIDIVAEMEE